MVISKVETTTPYDAIPGKTLFGKDYFRELLKRVRSIRARERCVWQIIPKGTWD